MDPSRLSSIMAHLSCLTVSRIAIRPRSDNAKLCQERDDERAAQIKLCMFGRYNTCLINTNTSVCIVPTDP